MFSIIFSLINSVSLVDRNLNAQNIPDVCEGSCPLIGTNTITNFDSETIASFIIGVAQFFSYISIAIAVLFLVISGLQLVTDTGDGKRAESGRKNFTSTIIGLILVIVAFTIVQVLSRFLSGDVLSDFTF